MSKWRATEHARDREREKNGKIVTHMLEYDVSTNSVGCVLDPKMRWIFTYYIVFIAMLENSARLPFHARARWRPTKAAQDK